MREMKNPVPGKRKQQAPGRAPSKTDSVAGTPATAWQSIAIRVKTVSSREKEKNVAPPDDSFEREAERAADQVLTLPDQGLPQNGSLPPEAGTSGGSGDPLPEPVRTFFAPRFGLGLEQVRLHAGADAEARSHQLGASAFTQGSGIYFGRGQLAPETSAGRRLLAHELAHVVQQTPGDRRARRDSVGASLARAVPGRIQRSLVATGDSAGFAAMANSVITVQQEVIVSPTGEVSLRATDIQGPPSLEQSVLVDVLNRVISHSNPTTIAFTHGLTTSDPLAQQVIVGSYNLGMIDLDDIAAFGSGLGISSASTLIHEIQEQFRKQVHREAYPAAHASGIAEEQRATGATRGADRARRVNATTIEITTPFTFPSGRTVEVTVTLTGRNITRVTRTVVP